MIACRDRERLVFLLFIGLIGALWGFFMGGVGGGGGSLWGHSYWAQMQADLPDQWSDLM